MKIILVTSEITYCPDNYNPVLEAVLRGGGKHVAGAVIIKISRLSVFKKIPFLCLAGCKNMARVLMQNVKESRLKKKEKLFKEYQVPVLFAKNINDPGPVYWLKKTGADLIINMRARCAYNDTVLNIPRLGCINLHHGILPEQRGLFCDLHALAGNKETGFSIHKMTGQIDGGPIIYREKIQNDNNYIDYLRKCSIKEGEVLAGLIRGAAQNNFLPEGTIEKCDQPIITTTPGFKAIKRIQGRGIIL